MSDESAGGGTGGKLPEAESLVPGGGEGIGTVRGNDLSSVSAFKSSTSLYLYTRKTYTIRDNVRVTVKGSFWVAVRALVAGQVPDDQTLVAGPGQEHVGVLE